MAYGRAPAECEVKGFEVYYLPNEWKVAVLIKYQFICDVVLHIQSDVVIYVLDVDPFATM